MGLSTRRMALDLDNVSTIQRNLVVEQRNAGAKWPRYRQRSIRPKYAGCAFLTVAPNGCQELECRNERRKLEERWDLHVAVFERESG